MLLPKRILLVAAAAGLTIPAARACAQDSGPVALLLPASAGAASSGNAMVAVRDDYVIFSNPAQIAPTNGFGLSFATYGSDSRAVAATAVVTVAAYTFGWGVHLVDFSTPRTNTTYPFAPAALTASGDADIFSMVATVAASRTIKRFRVGLAAKYAQDVVPRETAASGILVVPTRGAAILADIGASRPFLGGTAGLAVQNIGDSYRVGASFHAVPTQVLLGWADQRQLGPLDLAYTTQVTGRRAGWVSPGAGLDVRWSWIDGYAVSGSVGARRTETDDERPVGLGASFAADRLLVQYGVNFFAGNTAAHRVTLRWR